MKRTAIASIIALAVAAPAFADTTQLAASLGVDPGAYTLSELVELRAAVADSDQQRVDFILSGGADVISTQSGVSAGQEQLAASVGVDAGQYSLSEIVQIRRALEDDEFAQADFVKAGGSDVVSTQSGISAGHQQLANMLGLDASEYTLAELARIKASRDF